MIIRIFQMAAWLALAVIIFVTVSPIDQRPHDVLSVGFDRAFPFAVMAALFVLAYPRHWILVGLAIILSAGGIELLQELSPTRHARFDNATVKAFGAAVGVLAGWMLKTILARLNHRPASVHRQ